MKVTIVPASTQAGKAVVESLLGRTNPPRIRALYRDVAKAPTKLTGNTHHEALQGGLDDGLNLDFGDSDAVFYIPPPTYDDEVNSREHATRAADKVKEALRKASSVKRLVVLSALGAQHSRGIVGVRIQDELEERRSNDFAGHPPDQPHHRQDPRGQRRRGGDRATGMVSRELGRRTKHRESRSAFL